MLNFDVRLHNRLGFTLIEIMFAFGIFFIVIFGIFALFDTSSKANKDIW